MIVSVVPKVADVVAGREGLFCTLKYFRVYIHLILLMKGLSLDTVFLLVYG